MKPKLLMKMISAIAGCFVVVALQCMSFLPDAKSIMSDYTPLSASDLGKHFFLSTVKEQDQLTHEKTITVAGAKISLSTEKGDALKICGNDVLGRQWNIFKRFFGLGTAIFHGDLDQNGKEDLILLQSTGACGIAPPSVVTLILFDPKGIPHVFEWSGYSSADKNGWEASSKKAFIDDILDLNKDGRAEIVTEQLDYAFAGNKDRSYWRTVIYQAKDSNLVRLRTYKNYALPTIVAYKFKPNHRPVSSPVKHLLQFDDGGERPSLLSAHIHNVVRDEQGLVTALNCSNGAKFSALPQYANQSGDQFVPFLTVSLGKSYDIVAMDLPVAGDILSAAAKDKRELLLQPRTSKGHMPLRLFLHTSKQLHDRN